MLEIPTLRTARLRLRPQQLDDFNVYAAFLASPRARGMGGRSLRWRPGASSATTWPAGICSVMVH